MQYSHSSLDVARSCMKKFKYKYIDHIKMPEDKEASDFGSVIHAIAEHYKGGGKEELLKLYHEQVPSKYTITDKYKKKIPLGLKNVHEYWKQLQSDEIQTIQHEENCEIELNQEIKLVGKIDIVITYSNNKIKIVDYKTSKSKEYANHTNQLAMYMLLLNRKYGIKYEDMDCEIIYLSLDPETKKGKQVLNEGYENISKIYKLDSTDVDMLMAEIDSIHKTIQRSIETGKWRAKPDSFTCKYCQFNSLCEEKYKEEEYF